jgi:hypothetical protein
VAQFLAVTGGEAGFAKEKLLEELPLTIGPDFTEPNEPHSVLASLPLPVYMTTNYDDFMVRALRARDKQPQRELCAWNESLKDSPSVFRSKEGFVPSALNPVVFHLHGHNEVPDSLVLTEDDYLDYMVNISKDSDLIPTRIQEALTGSSLLFVGYSLSDWNFRVLFRGLISSMERSLRRISVTVQLVPTPSGSSDSTNERVQNYLDDYFKEYGIRTYWGTARDFVSELQQRWKDFNLVNGSPS